MAEHLPVVTLVRHGETAWSVSGQHTGRADIPLTPAGEAAAVRLAGRLRGHTFARVWTSPTQRARRTCELAGFAAAAEVDPDLSEWDYGEVEGVTSNDYRAKHPGWDLFRDGAPGGESVADVAARADRVVAKLRAAGDGVLAFSSGHFLRVVAARWVGADAAFGRHLTLGTAAVCRLGYEHDRPSIRLWNSTE